jgi:hypothetical protein
MTKPTPGPWEAKGAYVFAGKNCIGICDTDNATQKRMEANAKLIAAAPDLLAALELISSFGGKTLIGDGRYDEGAAHAFAQAADVASAALAKAVTEPCTPPTTTEDQ